MKWPYTGTAGNQLAPKSFQSWFLWGLYLQTNKFNEAIAALQQARSLQPKPQFYSLGCKLPARKVQRGDSKFRWFKVKTQ